jgi:hypothetical protein
VIEMKKIKREIVICLDDGYHEPYYYFQFGSKYSRMHMIDFLCKPHKEEYIILTVYYDDIDQTIETDADCILIEEFGAMSQKDRIKNFDKLVKIYYGIYS